MVNAPKEEGQETTGGKPGDKTGFKGAFKWGWELNPRPHGWKAVRSTGNPNFPGSLFRPNFVVYSLNEPDLTTLMPRC